MMKYTVRYINEELERAGVNREVRRSRAGRGGARYVVIDTEANEMIGEVSNLQEYACILVAKRKIKPRG